MDLINFNFDNSYLRLNNVMHSQMKLKNNHQSEIKILNKKLAKKLDISLDFLISKTGINILSGNKNDLVSHGYAQSYAGHQFGHFSILGDGRALMLGELVLEDKTRFDIQLKGSGLTPYSRRGDGLGTLSSMLREYLISEAMHHLNIPTTRSLAVIKTNEKIRRNQYADGGILTRVAQSHIRVGTFEFANSKGGSILVKELADYTIDRHYTHLNKDSQKYLEFFKEVVDRQARLLAKWQSVGFVHGVMNTDNVLISGQTIDYGPCAFMNAYDHKTVFSSIDANGRYAYGNQPYISSWNMSKLAETLLPLINDNIEKSIKSVNKVLENYEKIFNKYWLNNMTNKLGILNVKESDIKIVQDLLNLMELNKEDFTNTFRLLTINDISKLKMSESILFKTWYNEWQNRILNQDLTSLEVKNLMKNNNPYLIPRNNIVEEALKNAATNDDYKLFEELIDLYSSPYNYDIEYKDELINPKGIDSNYVTYCGT